MEKILNIGDQKVRFKSTAAFAKKYKAQFHRNIFSDLFKLSNAVNKGDDGKEEVNFEALDFDLFYDIAWVLAKTADDSIPPVEEWLDSFETFPIEEIMPQLLEMVEKSITSSVSKKK